MKKRIALVLLAFVLCLSALTACNKKDADVTTVPDAPTPPPPEPKIVIVDGGQSAYQIVIASDAADFEEDAAYALRYAIKTLTGVELEVVADSQPAQDKEIVIGKTSRSSLYEVGVNYMDGYAILTSGERIIIEAGTNGSLLLALSKLSVDCFGVDINSDAIYDAEEIATLSVPISYKKSNAQYDFLVDAETLYICHDNSYMQKRMAYMMHEAITADIQDDDVTLTLTVTKDFPGLNAYSMMLLDNDALDPGTWTVSLTDKTVSISAADYYGFTGAMRYLSATNAKMGYYNVIPNTTVSGSYKDTLEDIEGGTAYAYNRTAEHRIMFYNVLWDNPVPAERNLLNAEMVAQYNPDVLGLQEFNNSKRDGAGDNNLVTLLGELGYVETVDPRVKNVDAAKWGDGGKSVTVNNETYKTYYNCTPLFYNTNTTRCIASEYYWYENQIDAENKGNCGVMDCASKAMTWGVFETIETGERYIVVSTHMCTRSDGVKGLQAIEAVNVVNGLIAEYDCPVFFGGDLNGRTVNKNHIYFTSEDGGFTDVERNDLASLYTSKTKAHHRPYPAVKNEYEKLVWPTADDDTGTFDASESVDHILLHNHKKETVSITVFGTVVDHCTLSGADHFPIYVDFSIS